jgi:hypothetical protein
MLQNPSWEADSCWISVESPAIYETRSFITMSTIFHNKILSQLNPVHALTSYFWRLIWYLHLYAYVFQVTSSLQNILKYIYMYVFELHVLSFWFSNPINV